MPHMSVYGWDYVGDVGPTIVSKVSYATHECIYGWDYVGEVRPNILSKVSYATHECIWLGLCGGGRAYHSIKGELCHT